MKRALLLGLVVILVFAAVAALMLQFMAQPLKDSDYLVVGSVSTLVALVVLFFMVAASKPGMFLTKRKRR